MQEFVLAGFCPLRRVRDCVLVSEQKEDEQEHGNHHDHCKLLRDCVEKCEEKAQSKRYSDEGEDGIHHDVQLPDVLRHNPGQLALATRRVLLDLKHGEAHNSLGETQLQGRHEASPVPRHKVVHKVCEHEGDHAGNEDGSKGRHIFHAT